MASLRRFAGSGVAVGKEEGSWEGGNPDSKAIAGGDVLAPRRISFRGSVVGLQ